MSKEVYDFIEGMLKEAFTENKLTPEWEAEKNIGFTYSERKI